MGQLDDPLGQMIRFETCNLCTAELFIEGQLAVDLITTARLAVYIKCFSQSQERVCGMLSSEQFASDRPALVINASASIAACWPGEISIFVNGLIRFSFCREHRTAATSSTVCDQGHCDCALSHATWSLQSPVPFKSVVSRQFMFMVPRFLRLI